MYRSNAVHKFRYNIILWNHSLKFRILLYFLSEVGPSIRFSIAAMSASHLEGQKEVQAYPLGSVRMRPWVRPRIRLRVCKELEEVCMDLKVWTCLQGRLAPQKNADGSIVTNIFYQVSIF